MSQESASDSTQAAHPSSPPSSSAGREKKPRSYLGLKILVIGLGVAIVGGFIFVIMTIVERLSKPERAEVPSEVTVNLPANCAIADSWSEEGLVYFRLSGANCEGVLVLDGDKIVTRYRVQQGQ